MSWSDAKEFTLMRAVVRLVYGHPVTISELSARDRRSQKSGRTLDEMSCMERELAGAPISRSAVAVRRTAGAVAGQGVVEGCFRRMPQHLSVDFGKVAVRPRLSLQNGQ